MRTCVCMWKHKKWRNGAFPSDIDSNDRIVTGDSHQLSDCAWHETFRETVKNICWSLWKVVIHSRIFVYLHKSRLKTVINREFQQECSRFIHAVRPLQHAGFPGGLPENDQKFQSGGSSQNKVTGCTFSVFTVATIESPRILRKC